MHTKPGAPVMGIRKGKKPVIFKDAQEAGEKTGMNPGSIYVLIRSGRQSKKGWSFDYCLDGLKY